MLISAVILILIGAISLYLQVKKNRLFSDVTNEVPWRIYIVTYFFFAGAGGGLLFLSAVGELAFPGVSGIAAQIALGCFVGAGFSLLLDIGRPDRALNILKMKVQSPLFWDFVGLAVGFCGAGILLLWQQAGDFSLLRMGIGILCFITVFATEGWTLKFCPGRGLWNESLIAVALALEGLLLGLATLIVFGHNSNGVFRHVFLVITLLVLAFDYYQYSGEYFLRRESRNPNLPKMTFWILFLNMIACIVILMVNMKALFILAATFVLIAGLIEKYHQIMIPQISMAYNQWNRYKRAPAYKLELNKGMVVAGLFGIVGLTFEVLDLLITILR